MCRLLFSPVGPLYYATLFGLKRTPRVALATLYTPKHSGGLGFPNTQIYYQAVLLDQLRYWLSCQEDKIWVEVENKVTPGHDLFALMMASCLYHKVHAQDFPIIQATISTWSWLTRFKGDIGYPGKIEVPLRAYKYLILYLSNQKWAEKGVNFTLEDLGNKYAADTYKTNQIRHFQKANTVH